MKPYAGANVANITKIRQSDVFIGNTTTVVGTVTVPDTLSEGDAVKLGTLLTSNDGGETWGVIPDAHVDGQSYSIGDDVYFQGNTFTSTSDNNTNATSGAGWTDNGKLNINGILYNDITETKKTTVVVTGAAKGKYLHGFDEYLRPAMFDNKLFVK